MEVNYISCTELWFQAFKDPTESRSFSILARKTQRQNPPFPVLPYILPELGESALNNGEAS